jgi:hypothetical protein
MPAEMTMSQVSSANVTPMTPYRAAWDSMSRGIHTAE